MSSRPKRNIKQLKYDILGSTGEVVYKPDPQPEVSSTDQSSIAVLDVSIASVSTMSESDTITSEITDLIEEANDLINESPLRACVTPHEVDAVIEDHKNHRKAIRQKLKEVTADDVLRISIDKCYSSISNAINEAIDYKAKLNLASHVKQSTETNAKESANVFALETLERTLTQINKQFDLDLEVISDIELIQLKNESATINKRFEKISDKYQEVLKSPITKAETLVKVKEIGETFVKLDSKKHKFIKSVNDEVSVRKLDKDLHYNKEHLNIKIDQFKGYDSPVDYYTFKDNFEKLYLQTTPAKFLPDLLKNNFLAEPASTLVKSINDIDEIWRRLKAAFGDTKIMLMKKIQSLSKTDLSKIRDPEKLVVALSSLTNMLREVMDMAKKHNIESNLYYGETLNIIYTHLGDARLTRFLASINEDQPDEKETWQRLLKFLEREESLQQQKCTINNFKSDRKEEPPKPSKPGRQKGSYYGGPTQSPTCQICGETNHAATYGPDNTKIVQYFACQKFVEMTPAARLKTIRDKGLCHQCLLPGAKASEGKHQEGRCQRKYICPHPSHQRYPVKNHVLVCEKHKDDDANQEVLDKFKERCMKSSNLPAFSKEIQLSFHVQSSHVTRPSPRDSIQNRGIYLLQSIQVNGNQLNIFFDSGCSDFILSEKAVALLGTHAKLKDSRRTPLGGVGNMSMKSSGSYYVDLPLHDGRTTTLSGICLKQITSEFPIYQLKEVEEDIHNHYKSTGGTKKLPKLQPCVGGEIHLMIGVKYMRYQPRPIHQLPSGLTLFESSFASPNGERGVIGGPHKVFTQTHKNFPAIFLTHRLQESNSDVPLLGYGGDDRSSIIKCDDYDCSSQSHLSKLQRVFEEVESTGSEINYRCPSCRTCTSCKNHEVNQAISIKEEVEQSLIESSVSVDLETSTTTATLPFIDNPQLKLAPNKDLAMKVYRQQLRKLNQPANTQDKQDVIQSEQKLQQMGFVEYVKNLPQDIQRMLQDSPIQNYIPWRAVWKGNSVSTPCRVVFDASQATPSGYSLNDILAKGRNELNKLQEILIRWSMHRVALHTDISKMYNTVQLKQSEWCYQRYIWNEDLNPDKIPEEKVIKTLIYGVRSSGNQAAFGLRKVTQLSQEEFPEVSQTINDDVYVDDCISGEDIRDTAHQRADQLELVLNRGGYRLKGVTFSGEDPPSNLTDDGDTIFVGGMRWHVKEDTLSINISDLNFAKKQRGKKPSNMVNIIPKRLTRRHCSSKVSEVFDLTGKVAPIVASLKMDVQQLVLRKLDWDDPIPDDLRPIWESNFELIKSIGTIKFKRAIVPEDAINLDINTLNFGDASKTMICSCIYARFKRRNGSYSCQLVFARTRVVPKDMSLPRAELYAALTNAYTGEVVRRSFKDYHKDSIKFTDSQICLHWLSNNEKPLKLWTRNRVIETLRFTSKEEWYYVQSKDMAADIGTRKGATIHDVDQNSTWINGFNWMKSPQSAFPMLSSDEIRLSETESLEAKKEVDVHFVKQLTDTKDRYAFSGYHIDPMRHSFSKVVRIFAYAIRFCKIYILKTAQRSTPLTDADIEASKQYFFRMGTREVVQFIEPKRYEKFTSRKGDLLIYTGRILPEDEVTITGRFTSAMRDLAGTTFCVPVLDKDSPIAQSLALDVHWNHPVCKHSGVESTLRYILKSAYIIDGRQLVKSIRKQCTRCRYLTKKTVESTMGPIPQCSMTIAPPFYGTQVDLSGPFNAYNPFHKRTTVKIWLVVFVCCTTSATSITIMDDYSTESFIMAFIRFSNHHGFPKGLFCDSGSQLIKGCNEMRLNFNDLQHQLHKRVSVEFTVCPVGGHNMNGKAERKIREINKSIERSAHKEKLSLMQWETLASIIANNINDMPINIGSKCDVENLDLITPNRLLLGRSNQRSPTGEMVVCDNPSKILKENLKIYNAWFENWLLNHVPKLMEHPKWFKGDKNLQVGDIVLFTKTDSPISSTYQYGMITEVEPSKDGIVRKVRVKYTNANESTSRETFRSVRNLVLIQSIDEMDFMDELHDDKTSK